MIGSKDSQELEFYAMRAIDAQLRAETGAAAPPEELKRLTREFLSNALADPDATFTRLNELEIGLRDVRIAIDPTGRYANQGPSPFDTGTQPSPFELDENGLPIGSELLQ